jgi:methylated-DNA-[protein]-cysteine S-methyltransferase
MDKIIFETILGNMKITSENGFLKTVDLTDEPKVDSNEAVLLNAKQQMLTYFKTKTAFDLPLNPKGTPFQQKVYEALLKIPYGKTASYGEIAAMIGKPKAARAVGQAVNKNPLMIIVPCHRIIGKDGSLTGFNGGLALKEKLLKIEGIR